jgi:hypothetical protein
MKNCEAESQLSKEKEHNNFGEDEFDFGEDEEE